MLSVRDGYCQSCSAWWPSPVTYLFMPEPVTLNAFLSLLSIIISCHVYFPLASSSPNFLLLSSGVFGLDTKRENDGKSACDCF